MKTPSKSTPEMQRRLRAMRKLWTIGVPKAEIARRYGISRQRAHQLLGKKGER